jgi:hypothetical protein
MGKGWLLRWAQRVFQMNKRTWDAIRVSARPPKLLKTDGSTLGDALNASWRHETSKAESLARLPWCARHMRHLVLFSSDTDYT